MNFPELEEKILKKWRAIKAFEKSVSSRPKDRTFVFYEGPPTANGMPGFHHVEARSYKDVICRYKTMRGFRVERRAGWDTHGLPVEIQVEKELGLNSKKEIEEYGIDKFNAKCRESVWRYKGEWENITERMGFWIDMDDPYITLNPLYMETLWWIIKQAWDKKLLYEGHKVVPYCTRCGTSISSHEVAQGYQMVKDISVTAKFEVESSKLEIPGKSKTYILAWTTTPWTLPGNVALAVGEDIKYSVVKKDGDYYIVASDLIDVIGEEEPEVVKEVKGKELVGIEYKPLFNIKELQNEKSHQVHPADFVTTEEGTGIVHTAVMYGEDDYNLGDELGLPKKHTVDLEGKFNELVKGFEGKLVTEQQTTIDILIYLKEKGLLFKKEKYEHSYPHCWRCGTPLLYYAMHSWFMAMEKLKDDLLEANEEINWVPAHIKEGRFGDWLRNVKDWAFSRSRYWGTPLPVWRCSECFHVEVVGSREDLAEFTKGRNNYWLLRHGHSERNQKNILASVYPEEGEKFEITDDGREDVEKAAKQLKKEGGVDIIVASPLTRTRQTAEIVAKELGVDVEYNEDLLDVNVGIFENKHEDQYHEYLGPNELEHFTKGVPEGENLAQVRKRMLGVIDNLEQEYKGKNILIVSHGHPLWVLEGALRGFSNKELIARKEVEYPRTGHLRKVDYAKFPYNNEGELDFHRPFVDDIEFPCTICDDENSKMKRVEDLVDVWYDSGSMPFAQQHYPFENKDDIDKGIEYPADYITEAMDQTRGWFYTLLAVSAILGKAPSYKNVITLGIVLDENGQKMSKSKGNIVDPWELADEYGMDAVRWYFFTVNQPDAAKLFSEKDLKERLQRFISTLANSHSFLNIYAPDVKPPAKLKSSDIMDAWIYARLKELNSAVVGYMEDYNVLEAARALDNFVVEDLSNWYIRRSRTRLQRPENKKQKEEAAGTLAFVLNEIAKMTSPFIPFLSEHIWQDLNQADTQSVHWQDYPVYKKLGDKELDIISQMRDVRAWAQEGLRLRADSGIKVRQPLEAFAVDKDIPAEYAEILKDEINVKNVVNMKEAGDDWAHSDAGGAKTAIKTALSEALIVEGQAREMMRNIQNMRRKLGLKPSDKISVKYNLDSKYAGKLAKYEDEIANTTGSEISEAPNISEDSYDIFKEYDWDSQHKVRIGIKKI